MTLSKLTIWLTGFVFCFHFDTEVLDEGPTTQDSYKQNVNAYWGINSHYVHMLVRYFWKGWRVIIFTPSTFYVLWHCVLLTSNELLLLILHCFICRLLAFLCRTHKPIATSEITPLLSLLSHSVSVASSPPYWSHSTFHYWPSSALKSLFPGDFQT